MTMSEEIKFIRQKAFLSQDQFADKLGVSLSTVNRWETSKAKPNLKAMKTIKAFCEYNNLHFGNIEKEWLIQDKENRL